MKHILVKIQKFKDAERANHLQEVTRWVFQKNIYQSSREAPNLMKPKKYKDRERDEKRERISSGMKFILYL